MKKALVTGISGQDGSYLAELLLEKGYEVHGIVRRSSRGYGALENIIHLVRNPEIYRKTLHLHIGDLCDTSSLMRIMREVMPDEIYNLAAQADVAESFYQSEYTHDATGQGVVRMLEAMRQICPQARFYQASTSELFGKCDIEPQNEETPMNPQSPYAVAKYVGYQTVKNYREGYGLFACNGICFNHASPRRTDDYLDRKVTRAVGRIKMGLQKDLRLGNLYSWRDWTHAQDMVKGMWLMLQQDKPDDYVLGSGSKIQVKDWVEKAFAHVGLDMNDYVVIDQKLFRPNEVDNLLADNTKAREKLGWEISMDVDQLIQTMVDQDVRLAKYEKMVYEDSN